MIPKYLMKSPEMRSLLEFAMHNEVITMDECYQFYSSDQRLKGALKYLVANTLLEKLSDEVFRFVPVNERGDDLFELMKKDKDKDVGEI